MNACTMEHRWEDRSPLDIPVQLVRSSRIIGAGRLTNFSISGAFVETEIAPPVMASITLTIVGAKGSPRHLRAILGYVVRQGRNGFGMSWWSLAPVTAAQLVAISYAVTSGADLLLPSQMYY